MRAARFETEPFEGHKGVIAVLVPFDPELVWNAKPTRLAGRRHGWPINGQINGVRFVGYIGERWNRFFITLEEPVRTKAKVRVGRPAKLVIEPTTARSAVATAIEQSKLTTQPKRARPDAVERAADSTPATSRASR